MARVTIRGADLYFEEHGTGAEVIVFAHGCLLNCRQFDAQLAAFRGRYRCIAFDFRGQGRSQVTRRGYDMDSLTEDAAGLIRALGGAPCHFVGSSMGGFVGMRLAVRHAELLRSLVLVGSSASPEPSPWRFRLMSWAARLLGVRAVTPGVMPVQFGPHFLRDPRRDDERRAWFERIATASRAGAVRSAGGVISRPDFTGQLGRVRVPTLIVVGEDDRATPPEEARRMHAGIAASDLVIIPQAGHAVVVEQPAAVNQAVQRFLERNCDRNRGGVSEAEPHATADRGLISE
ncbi:alpha/beta fold hydrolase [Urbifossiella limnaea]|uniref:3-oxoadipate enol-lactonase 2 n=1 Tax=Urbifossiella limnaea TaxID=2528023 RepID=A0A517Y307_9BACT|nr:alpha/beta fold hydrolase [Urbifossiella limnaea]QDU24121.1 3-oxoadipate enol-lactonase 2 [Urbifossiella limnaea]